MPLFLRCPHGPLPIAVFMLCTKPKACASPTRGAWAGEGCPRPCQRQGACSRWEVNTGSRAQQVREGLWKACGPGRTRELGCFSVVYGKLSRGEQDGLGGGINLCRKRTGLPPSDRPSLLAARCSRSSLSATSSQQVRVGTSRTFSVDFCHFARTRVGSQRKDAHSSPMFPSCAFALFSPATHAHALAQWVFTAEHPAGASATGTPPPPRRHLHEAAVPDPKEAGVHGVP